MHAPFRRIMMTALVLSGAGLVSVASWGMSQAGEERLKVGDYQLSGPHVHDNLSIVLVHGLDHLKGKKFLMLAKALEQKKFVIHETQQVNTLAMENLADIDVIIMSGDILKGGQQDRISQFDLIVPPKSGKLPLQVFCVEHTASRWMQPLTDQDKTFASCPGQICTNDLRLANRAAGSQGDVWKDVAKAQEKLSDKANVDVKAKESDSSLALSLQAKEVQAAADKYTAKLEGILEGKADVVGYAFAINGKVVSADIYGSPALFREVWTRLLRANAIEAFAALQKDKPFTAPKAQAFQAFLESANKGKEVAQDANKGLRQTKNETDRVLRFETIDPKQPQLMLRSHHLAY